MFSSSGPRASYDSREPPGMMLGPLRAPSSPPEMPAPTKCRPCSRSAASRRRVSSKWALPPSTTMSPASRCGTSSSITASVGRAGLDHDDDPAWALQARHELLDRGRGQEAALVAVLLHEQVGLGLGAVEEGDGVPAAGEVAGEVAAHHGQSHHPDLRLLGLLGAHGAASGCSDLHRRTSSRSIRSVAACQRLVPGGPSGWAGPVPWPLDLTQGSDRRRWGRPVARAGPSAPSVATASAVRVS